MILAEYGLHLHILTSNLGFMPRFDKHIKMMNTKIRNQKGFTLIEILVVIGIIAVLATIVLIAINPARQFAQSRDTQRTSHVNSILNAIGQRIADNRGIFAGGTCPAIPAAGVADQRLSILNDTSATTATTIGLGCIAPTYMTAVPLDPRDATGADTGYDLIVESIAEGGRLTIEAPGTEVAVPDISLTR